MILYDSQELLGTTYVPRTVSHESAPMRLLNTVKLARQDGTTIVSDTFDEKYIEIPGILTATTTALLEAAIDNMKELISRKDKNLDIVYAGGTRRYVCRSVAHEFNRDHFHLLFVPYKVKFYIVGVYGKDTSETTALNLTGQTGTSISSGSITYAGSVTPKLRHKITMTTRGNADTLRITAANGDYIEVDLDGFVNSDYVEIDEANQTILKNGATAINYRGKFPSVGIGAATLTLTVAGSGSYAYDQYQTSSHGGSSSVIYNNTSSRDPIEYQSFIPTRSGRRKQISVYVGVDKDASLTGNALFSIHEDNNGVPGVQIGGSFQLNIAGWNNGAYSWWDFQVTGTAPFLVAGRKYWIRNFTVTGLTGANATNFFRWFYSDQPTDYLYGKAIAQKNSSTAFVDGAGASHLTDGVIPGALDFKFYEYTGDGEAANHTLTWAIYYTKRYL